VGNTGKCWGMEKVDHSDKVAVLYIPAVCHVHITKLNEYNEQYFLPATILLVKEQHQMNLTRMKQMSTFKKHLKNHLVEFSHYSI